MVAAELLKTSRENVVKKFQPVPKFKPPRRRPSFQNKSDRSNYQTEYTRKYRDQGKGYQKAPDAVKKWRMEQKRRLREKLQQSD